MADETQDFDTVTIPELDDLTIALTSYFATSNLNGKLGKATVADFVTFITPYIQGVAASGFVPITGNVLPVSPAKSFSIVGAGTFTQSTGGNLVTTALFNLISNGNGTTWSLVKAIDTSAFLSKVEYNYGGKFSTIATANATIPNTVINGTNQRDGKRVDIGTGSNYTPYWWKGGTADINLVEFRSTKNDPSSSKSDNLLSANFSVKNLFNYIDSTNWVDRSGSTNLYYSHYINVHGLSHIYMSTKPLGFWYWYNSDKIQIAASTATIQEADVPAGAVYLRFLQPDTAFTSLSGLTVTDKISPNSGLPFGYVAKGAEDLPEVKNTVSIIKANFEPINLFNYNDPTNWLETFSGYNYSHYMNVQGLTHIYMSIKPLGFWYWYNADKTVISSTSGQVQDLDVPAGAVYLRFLHPVANKTQLTNLTVSDKAAPTSGKPYGYAVKGIETAGAALAGVNNIRSIIGNTFVLSNLFNYNDPTNWVDSYDATYKYSHYMNVQGIAHIYMSIKPFGFWVWYNSAKVQISSTSGQVQDLDVPAGAVYLRFLQPVANTALLANLTVSDQPSPVSGKPFGYTISGGVKGYLEDKKYIALGDSITDGDGSAGYTWFDFLLDTTNSRSKAVDLAETGQCLRTMADKLNSTNIAGADRIFVFGGTNQETNFTLGALTDLPTPDVRKASTAYNVGDRVSGGTKEAHGWTTPLYTFNQKYICTVAGTSGTGEPTGFNTTTDSLTVDGTVTWKCEGANTWYGDLWRVATKIWGLSPFAEIIWFTPIRTRDYVGFSQDFRSSKFNAIGTFCDYNGIKNIDLRKDFYVNPYTKSAIMADDLHPNLAGTKAIFDILMRNM